MTSTTTPAPVVFSAVTNGDWRESYRYWHLGTADSTVAVCGRKMSDAIVREAELTKVQCLVCRKSVSWKIANGEIDAPAAPELTAQLKASVDAVAAKKAPAKKAPAKPAAKRSSRRPAAAKKTA